MDQQRALPNSQADDFRVESAQLVKEFSRCGEVVVVESEDGHGC